MIADEDMLIDLLTEVYSLGYDEGVDDTIEQAGNQHLHPPPRPHKDCRSEGIAAMLDDFRERARATFQ